MESRLVPLSDARLPGPRASRRDVRHCRRPFRHRVIARDEPGRTEGRRGRSGPRAGRGVRREHGGHLPPQRLQPRTARGAESRGGRRCARRRRFQLRSGDPPAPQRDPRHDLHPGAAVGEGRGDSPQRRHLRGRPPRAEAIGGDDPQPRLGACRPRAAHVDHRADRVGPSGRQGSVSLGAPSGRDAARLRGSAAGVRRHRAVRDPHLQPDHRRPHHRSSAGGDCQRSFRVHGRRRRRQTDRHRPRVRASCTIWSDRITPRPATGSFTSIFPSRA